MSQQIMSIFLTLLLLLSGCGFSQETPDTPSLEPEDTDQAEPLLSGTVPAELEYVPDGYTRPADHPGTAANEYMYNALRFFWNP